MRTLRKNSPYLPYNSHTKMEVQEFQLLKTAKKYKGRTWKRLKNKKNFKTKKKARKKGKYPKLIFRLDSEAKIYWKMDP